MKDKSYLILIEQIMMILIFAIVSALCIQVFVEANKISVDSKNRDKAVIIVQNTAECMIAGKEIGNTYYDEDWNIVESNKSYMYQLIIESLDKTKGLEKISIKVSDKSLKVLFKIKIARQVAI